MDLASLIADCGNWFSSLVKKEDTWGAVGMDATVVGTGSTPEDAVFDLKTKLIERGAITDSE